MPEYIRREALIKRLQENFNNRCKADSLCKYVIDKITTFPAVEVIRCHNCQHWMYEAEDIGLCVADVPDIDGVQRYGNDFCSYGERKEG